MRGLVVGGAGFIGSHLCDRLIKDGHHVCCLDNFSLGNEKQIYHLLGEDKFRLEKKDAVNIEELRNVFESFSPDYVFHLAANSDIQASSKNPDIEYLNTYSTTFKVLEVMREFKIKKLFFSSTSAVYGDKRDEILDENTANLSPISYYGAAKLGSEALISAFSYMDEIQSLIFRFPNVIGPRLTHGVIFDFIRKLKEDNTRLKILGDGRQTKPYIYVTDLVDAIIELMNISKKVELYNVGVDGTTSVTRIADIVCEEMGLQNVKYAYTGGESGWKGDVPNFRYCIDKIHNTGWKASYTSDEAVRMTVQKTLEEKI